MKKILLIEDNIPISEELTLMLQLENYEVIEAKEGAQGFELARQLRPDLIISDISMPGLDGFEMLTKIREHITTLDIPFVFLTSRAEKVNLELARELGADDYLLKPFTPLLLLKIIKTQLIKRTSAIVIVESPLTQPV